MNRNQLRRYVTQELECTMIDHTLRCITKESTLNKLKSLHFTIDVNLDESDELRQKVKNLIQEVECSGV
ncbi:hypothetical protein ACQCN2_08195 [Brevibacillus ginsengisoli]|uniref:hypothetical protein n=1 Tax=Brevibacillus ginsengisoli TaxID=363854 RepID=UPI003CF8A83A